MNHTILTKLLLDALAADYELGYLGIENPGSHNKNFIHYRDNLRQKIKNKQDISQEEAKQFAQLLTIMLTQSLAYEDIRHHSTNYPELPKINTEINNIDQFKPEFLARRIHLPAGGIHQFFPNLNRYRHALFELAKTGKVAEIPRPIKTATADKTIDAIYLAEYQDQIHRRRRNIFLTVLAAIFLTPLSLFITIPMLKRAENNELIKRLTVTDDEINNVSQFRKRFWLDFQVTENNEKNRRDNLIEMKTLNDNNEFDPKPKKHRIPNVFIGKNFTSEKSVSHLYMDKHSAHRFQLFRKATKANRFSDIHKRELDESKLQSREAAEEMIARHNKQK